MFKKAVLILMGVALCFALSACQQPGEMHFVSLPAGLKDCKFYAIGDNTNGYMRIARCPDSTASATYRTGKRTETTVTIDGVEYVRKDGSVEEVPK